MTKTEKARFKINIITAYMDVINAEKDAANAAPAEKLLKAKARLEGMITLYKDIASWSEEPAKIKTDLIKWKIEARKHRGQEAHFESR